MTDKKAMLNLTLDNLRAGDISENHCKVDILYNGKKVSEYQWNPFYFMDIDKMFKDVAAVRKLKIILGWESAVLTKENLKLAFGQVWRGDLKQPLKGKLLNAAREAYKPWPDVYDVESALVLDATSFEESSDFEDFCDIFGYDSDSKKAEGIYNACKDTFLFLVRNSDWDKLKKLHAED